MIKTIIFDFGDVLINLDKAGALKYALEIFEIEELDEELTATNALYEQGLISTDEFLDFYLANFPKVDEKELIKCWNHIIVDFPKYRYEFIKKLAESKKYKLILLSNTNELHIDCIQQEVIFYEKFKECFDAFYLSHEIGLRKPDASIFNFVLNEHNLKPEECLFIDDTTENTEAAKKLGIHTWNNDPEKEDVVDLFDIKSELF